MWSRTPVFAFLLIALATCVVGGVDTNEGTSRGTSGTSHQDGFDSKSGIDRTPSTFDRNSGSGSDIRLPGSSSLQGNTRPSQSGPNREGGLSSGLNNYDRETIHGGNSKVPERNQEGSTFSSFANEGSRPIGSQFSNRPEEHGFSNSQGGTRPSNSEYQNRPSELSPNREGERFPTGGLTSGSSNHGSGNVPGGSRPEHGTGSSNSEYQNRPSQFGSDGDRFPSGSTGGLTSRPDHQEGHNQNRPIGEDVNLSNNNNQGNKGSGNKDGEKKPDEEEEEVKEVCYSYLGCFDMGKPWKSALRPVKAPNPPEKIATTLFFYSRENIDKQKNITLYPQVNMGGARFDPRKLSAIIVHGFANSGNASWMKDMKNAYLKQVDANVMLVDWGKGAQLLSYLQVAGNTRVVGKQLAMFVNFLKNEYGADPGKFHLIGHSLGAQICSYLAKDVPGIARLTALDPAQPGFEGFDKEVRLHSSDAEFVDVVHTDARPFLPTLGFGMIAPVGHVDFYMNGGFDQPGCIPLPKKDLPVITNILDLGKFPVEVIGKMVACPHARAYEYLTESFNETEKCIFWGHKADVSNVIKSVTNTVTQGVFKKFVALSTTCSKEDCIPLGFATKKSPLRGSFVVTTSGRQPYCISEPGIPAEVPPNQAKKESVIQKIVKG